MKKLSLIIMLISLFYAGAALAQNAQKQVKGKVKDSAGKGIESAIVTVKDTSGNTLGFSRTSRTGEYSVTISGNSNNLSIEASCIGYKKASIPLGDISKARDLVLENSELMLKEVVIKNRPVLKTNGDTLNYKTSDFSDEQDRSIGDVIRKMPGMEVDDNGKISFNGKPISNYYIDEDNLLDDKYNIANQSIPHGAVEKVQVIQNDQPIKMLRKYNMSEAVALNLVLKDEARLQVMGEAMAGLGTPERFNAHATAMLFKKKLKFINNLKGNNIGVDPGTDVAPRGGMSSGGFLSAGASGPQLPQNRSLFNRAGLANFNNLYHLGKDLQVKSNISYLYDQRRQQYDNFRETYLPGQTIRYTENQNNHINPQALNVQLDLINNATDHYLMNKLVLTYSPFSTSSDVVTNAVSLGQSLSRKPFDISNTFTYKFKLKSRKTIDFTSTLNKTSRPEILTITPGLNADRLNGGNPYASLIQQVDLPGWSASNSASLSFLQGKFSESLIVGSDLQQQRLESGLYRVQNDQTKEIVSPDMVNDLTWFTMKTYVTPTASFKGTRLTTTFRMPFSYNDIRYKDPGFNLDKGLSRFLINPGLNITYQVGKEQTVSGSYAFSNSLGASANQVYAGKIQRSYRSINDGRGSIPETRSQNFGASFESKKAVKMLFLNSSANYRISSVNTVSAQVVDSNLTQQTEVSLRNTSRSLSLNAGGSKYLFWLKATINGGIVYNRSWFSQMQNGILMPFVTENRTYRAGFSTRLAKFVNWVYNANYSEGTNRNSSNNSANDSWQLSQQSTLSFTTFKHVYVNGSAEHVYIKRSGQEIKYLFADMNINYKWIKRKTDIIFSMTNLANIREFKTFNVNTNSLVSGTYQIPGRVAMLRTIFNF